MVSVRAREAYPPRGIMVGDWLIVERRRPSPGELVLLGRQGVGPKNRIRVYNPDKAETLMSARRPCLIGVIVEMYREYATEESAHGPS